MPAPTAPAKRIFCRSCEGLVRAVAKRLFSGMLAGAKPMVARFLGRVFHRCEAGVLVGAVAKGLLLAPAAGAPPIVLACFKCHLVGCLGRDNRFSHVAFPVAAALLRCRACPSGRV